MNTGAHPRDRRGLGVRGIAGGQRPGLSRRAFLARAAGASVTAAGLSSLLAACRPQTLAAPRFAPLPGPRHPVTWPIVASNEPIAGGQRAEAKATLKIFTWPGHLSRRCVTDFSKAYRCQIQVTTFTTIIEALSTLARGRGRFDVLLGAPTDTVGILVGQGLVQPLNHGYIPNISQAWPMFIDPYYDSHWQYTVPYTSYTTGIAWRKDLVDMDPYALVNGWQFPWVAKRSGKTAILDDYRESIGLALLTMGIGDLNTADPYLIDNARQALLNLNVLVGGLRIDNDTAQQIATGQSWIHHAWSGQAVAAARHLPRGVSADAIGYWFPPDGAGPIGNDTGTVLRGARNPVLAHLFLNFMLDHANAMHNMASIGYMQPLNYATPHRLISAGILPTSLTSAAVIPTYLDHGLKELQLQATTDQFWRQAWRAVRHGH